MNWHSTQAMRALEASGRRVSQSDSLRERRRADRACPCVSGFRRLLSVLSIMFMNIEGFTHEQKQALLDLLIVGMYADHHLASPEDDRIQKLLDAFQFASDYERRSFSDAAFTRTRSWISSPEAIKTYVAELAVQFPTREIRRRTYETLDGLLTSDNRVTSEESQLLSTAKQAFEL